VEEEEESACFLAWSTYSDLRQKDFDVDLELGARSQKLEAGFTRPFRNEKALRNQRRNDLSFNSQQDERMSGV